MKGLDTEVAPDLVIVITDIGNTEKEIGREKEIAREIEIVRKIEREAEVIDMRKIEENM